MNSTTSRWLKILAVPLAATLVLGACSSDDESSDDGSDTTEASSGGDGGTVNVSGSSTVAPISTRVAELWADSGVDAEVNVDGPGTGDGFELFCEGETDISDASRPIEEEEIAACEDAGIEFIELKIAFDGIAVMTNPANEAIECLSFADIYAPRRARSPRASTTWADADGAGRRARLGHRAPRRAARHLRPRRGVRHLRLASSRS